MINSGAPLEILSGGIDERRPRLLWVQIGLYIVPPILLSLINVFVHWGSFWQSSLLYVPSFSIISLALWCRYRSQHPPRTLPALLSISILVLSIFLSFIPVPERQSQVISTNVSVDNWEKLLSFTAAGDGGAGQLSRSIEKEYDFKNELSVIIVIRDEEEFIAKTIDYVLEQTPDEILREIVIVDDASLLEASKLLSLAWFEKTLQKYKHKRNKIKLVRFNQKQGLIRAKIAGADLSVSPNIFFLDGHCRLDPLWYQPLLDRVNPDLVDEFLEGERIPSYKRIIIPQIYDIDRFTWEDKNTFGLKMMFDWTFEFDWFEDDSDLVPILPGGIQLITRRWWDESGKYDSGMLEWGGENIEQSLRTWLCGGAIIQTNTSRIGHIFDRPPKPNPNNDLVRQVQKNQKRAAIVWLDDYYQYLDKYHSALRPLDPGQGIEYRQYLRSQLQCKPFRWFVNKFKSTFERRGLLIHEYHYIQDKKTLMCLGAVENRQKISLQPCARSAVNQQWSAIWGGRFIHNLGTKSCLTKVSNSNKIILADCNWLKMLHNLDHDQFWQFNNGSIFSDSATNTRSKDGNDEIKSAQKILCVSNELVSVPCEQIAIGGDWQLLW